MIDDVIAPRSDLKYFELRFGLANTAMSLTISSDYQRHGYIRASGFVLYPYVFVVSPSKHDCPCRTRRYGCCYRHPLIKIYFTLSVAEKASKRVGSMHMHMHKLEEVFNCPGPVDFVAVGTFNETAQETSYVSPPYLSAPLTAGMTVQEGPPSPRTLSGSAPQRVRMVLGACSPRKCIIRTLAEGSSSRKAHVA